MTLDEIAFAKELAEAQHKALYAPKGLRRIREQRLRELVAAELRRELCVRETRQ